MIGFVYPVTAIMRPFLANKGHSAEEVDEMHQGWFESVVLRRDDLDINPYGTLTVRDKPQTRARDNRK